MTEIRNSYEDGIHILKIMGELVVDDVVDFVIQITPSLKDEPVLWDLTDANFERLPTEDFIQLAMKMKNSPESRAGAKVALVGDTDLKYGMLRVYNAWLDTEETSLTVNTFRSVEEARKWILF